jgi:3-oxoacyl-[acyl-carrier protein] reductase
MKLLEGKTAIVTGAARGIGEGIAIKFAEHGCNVAFTYVSDKINCIRGKSKSIPKQRR